MYVHSVHDINDENIQNVCPLCTWYQRREHTQCMSTMYMISTMRTHTMYNHSIHPIIDENTHNVTMYNHSVRAINDENTHNVCSKCTCYQRWEHTQSMSTVYMLSTMRTHTMYVYSVHAIAGRQRPLLDSLHVLRTTHQFFEVLWHQIVFHGNTSVSTPTLFPQICKWINGTRRSVQSRLPVSRKWKQSRTINRPPNVHWLNPC